MIGAGRRRHRVVILGKVQVPNGKGGFVTNYAPIGAPMMAEVVALNGREAMIEHVLQGISAYRVTMRWRGDVTTEHQLQLRDGRLLNIRSADDADDRRRELVIVADTVATLGS